MNREFSKKAQEVWNKLSYEDRLYATYFIFDQISEHMENNGTYRYLIYDRLGFNMDAYGVLMEAGGLAISNMCFDYWAKNYPEKVEEERRTFQEWFGEKKEK